MRLELNKFMKRDNETVQEYLGNRASRYMDSVMNGEYLEGTELLLSDILTAEETKRLKNHIYELMQPTVDAGIAHMINSRKISDMGDDYASECKLLIWKNIFRYNNPKYKASENSYTLGTFIKPYLLEPIRRTFCQHKELSELQSREAQMVNKAKSYIRGKAGKSDESISEEEIAENIQYISSSRTMTVDKVKSTIIEMQGREYLDAYKEYAKKSIEDEIFIREDNIVADFKAFLSEMRPMQQFIFLQYFGYATHRFEDIPMTQLVVDPYFVRIVKADEVGRNHVERKDSYTVKRARQNFEKAGTWNLSDVECVNVRFVSNERFRAKERLVKLVKEKDYSEDEIKANLFGLLEKLEGQIEEMFGLNL